MCLQFLMDEVLTFKKPDNVTSEQAATIGVGLLVSGPGLASFRCKLIMSNRPPLSVCSAGQKSLSRHGPWMKTPNGLSYSGQQELSDSLLCR